MNAGHWDKPLSIAAIGLVSQAAVVYLVPNGEQAPRRDAESPATRIGGDAAPSVA